MATESAADTELSVTLSPSLSAWIEERAATLGVDRETLLVHLVKTHREAADFDDDLAALLSDGHAEGEGTIDELNERIGEVDAALSEHVEDLRGRILQLKDAVNSRAPAEHDHPRIEAIAERERTLSTDVQRTESDLDAVESELEALLDDLEATDERLETAETKLYRLAEVVLELKRQSGGTSRRAEALEHLRRVANRRGTTEGVCGGCGKRLRIGLLTDAACPHCSHEFRGIERSTSFLGRFKPPILTDADSNSARGDDE